MSDRDARAKDGKAADEDALLTYEQAEDLERALFERLEREWHGAPPAGKPPLDFETWADLSSFFLGAEPDERRDVLEERGVPFADWAKSDAYYLRSLAADAEAGRTARMNAYARKCAEVVARRKTLPEPRPMEEAAEAEPAPPAAVAAAPLLPDAPLDVATFQKAEPGAAPLPPVVRAPEHLRGTMRAREMPTAMWVEQGKLPFAPGAAAPPAAAAPPVPVASPSPAAGVAPLPAVVRAPEHLRGTVNTPEMPAAHWEERGKLPFAPGAAAPPPAAAGAAPLPPVVRGPEALRTTAKAPDMPAGYWEERGKLPFAAAGAASPAGAAPPAPAPPPAPPPGTGASVGVKRAPAELAATLPLGADLSPFLPAAPPFEQTRGGGEAQPPELSLKQYVSFCVDVALAGDAQMKEEVMRAYGVRGETGRAALDEHWRKVFAGDPAQRTAFDGLCAQYTAIKRGQAPR